MPPPHLTRYFYYLDFLNHHQPTQLLQPDRMPQKFAFTDLKAWTSSGQV